jgi:hypothetical protein
MYCQRRQPHHIALLSQAGQITVPTHDPSLTPPPQKQVGHKNLKIRADVARPISVNSCVGKWDRQTQTLFEASREQLLNVSMGREARGRDGSKAVRKTRVPLSGARRDMLVRKQEHSAKLKREAAAACADVAPFADKVDTIFDRLLSMTDEQVAAMLSENGDFIRTCELLSKSQDEYDVYLEHPDMLVEALKGDGPADLK